MRNHFLSALVVCFFLFLAFGSDESDKNKSASSTETNQTSSPDVSQQNNEPLQEAPKPVVLNTDSIVQLHIEWLSEGVKFTRLRMKTSDPYEQKQLYAESEKHRENKKGDFSQIKDAMFFQNTFIKGFNKCNSIAEQISSSQNENEIDSLITDALIYQTLSSDALLYIQDPDLNYPNDKIKTLLKCYKSISGVFADERVLKLPTNDFKTAVTNALPDIQQSKQLLSNL